MSHQQNPIYLATMYLGLVLGLYFVLKTFPVVAPFLVVIAGGVLIYKFIQFHSEEKAANRSSKEDLQQINKRNIIKYSPWLKENVRGHNQIIDLVLHQLQQNLYLANEQRTLGAYFFVGPTGTGKTFLAELTAQALFPKSKPLVLRMNQYKHPSDVLTLLGPPAGHTGHEVGGTLTRPVLEEPCRVIILDEIDKCHKDVLDCLYNILDTAQCVEKSSGKIVSFNRCIFFATSNVGVEQLRQVDLRGKNTAYMHSKFREVLAENSDMDKAFLARWDGVFFMDRLSSMSVAEVACLQISKHWKQFGMEVMYTAPELIVETVRSNQEFKEFGVRQLANYIKMTTDGHITRAKMKGIQKVRLEVDDKTKQIVVKAA